MEGRRDQCEVPRDPSYPDCSGKVEVSKYKFKMHVVIRKCQGQADVFYKAKMLAWMNSFSFTHSPTNTALINQTTDWMFET